MDYNYVRMRNALKKGNMKEAEHYKQLYESGTEKQSPLSAVNCVIAILLIIAVSLGIYIIYTQAKIEELNIPLTEVVSEVQ